MEQRCIVYIKNGYLMDQIFFLKQHSEEKIERDGFICKC